MNAPRKASPGCSQIQPTRFQNAPIACSRSLMLEILPCPP